MAARFATITGPFLDSSGVASPFAKVHVRLIAGDATSGVIDSGAIIADYKGRTDENGELSINLPINDDVLNVANTYYIGTVNDERQWTFRLTADSDGKTYTWGDGTIRTSPVAPPSTWDNSTNVDAGSVWVDTEGWSGTVPNPSNTQDLFDMFDLVISDSILPILDGLGSASVFDVPLVGDASPTEVVLGSDSRLTSGKSRLVRDWARDGVGGITGVQYWQTAGFPVSSLPGGPHTLSVVGDSLRINSTAGNTNGNIRQAWLVSDEDFDDFEILVRIDKPSNIGVTMSPQPGLMLRGQGVGEDNGKAIAMFVNIFASYGPVNIYNFRPWARQPDGSYTDTGGSLAGTLAMSKLKIPVDIAGIIGSNILAAPHRDFDQSMLGQLVGQLVNYSPGVVTNGLSAVTGKTVTSTAIGIVFDSGGQPATNVDLVYNASVELTDISTSSGTPVPPFAWYPAYMRVRLVGRQMKSKWWHAALPEPRNWTNTRTLSEDAPLSGKIGLVTNHLHGADNYMAFGPVEITPIRKL